MPNRYIALVAFYFASFSLPQFYTNKYVLAFVPLFCLALTIWVCKNEIASTNVSALLQSKTMLQWTRKAFVWSAIGLALCNLVFQYSDDGTLKQRLLFELPVMSVYVTIVIPIVEETVFRKIMFGWLSVKFNAWSGAVVSSAIFAACHLTVNGLIGYFLVGFIYCYVYRKSGTIVPAIAAHALINFAAILVSSLKIADL